MNILQVADGNVRIPPSRGGGTESYILGISKSLAKLGNRVVLLDRKYTPADPRVEHVDQVIIARLESPRLGSKRLLHGPNIFIINLGYLVNVFLYAIRVKSWIKCNPEFDIINVHDIMIGLALVLAGVKNRIVYTQHGLSYERRISEPTTLVYSTLRGFLVQRVSAVVALNPVSMLRLSQEIRGRGTLVGTIPVGVDIDNFGKSRNRRDDVALKYDLQGRIILSVGRISKEKGTEVLVRAADVLFSSGQFPDVSIAIVGPISRFGIFGQSTPYFRHLVAITSSLRLYKKVRFLGNLSRDDLLGLYSGCKVFVLPSMKENFSQALVEAMAAGKPVVASKLPGTVSQVKDGWNGFLVSPGNEFSLAERITWLLKHDEEAQAMGSNGRKLAEEKFSDDSVARSLEVLYSRCLGRSGPFAS